MQARTESCKAKAGTPLPGRAQRLRQSTIEVENLFNRSTANRDPATAYRDPASHYPPRRLTPRGRLLALDERGVGIPMSQEVLEGQTPKSNSDYYNLSPQDNRRRSEGYLPDARSPGTRPGSGRFTMERSSAVPEQNARTRPANMHRGQSAAVLNNAPQGRRKDTMGLDSRQRYPDRQPRSEYEQNEGPRRSFTQDDRGFDSRMPQERHFQQNGPRGEGALDPQASRRQGGGGRRVVRENAFSERGPESRRAGPQSGRAGRPRTSRSDEGDEPRRRKPKNQTAGGTEKRAKISNEEILNDKEKEYLKQKRAREAAKSVAYEPGDVGQNTFSGVGPAVASGERGLSEVLGERLLLAKQHMDGEYVEWHSREQKADVMTLVGRLKREAKKPGRRRGVAEARLQTQSLIQKLLEGRYQFTRPQQREDIVGNVERHTDRNESYYPADQQSLLEKVKSLMPAGDIKKPPSVVRMR